MMIRRRRSVNLVSYKNERRPSHGTLGTELFLKTKVRRLVKEKSLVVTVSFCI